MRDEAINAEIAAVRQERRDRKKKVLKRAGEVLGCKADEWLQSAIPALGGQIPAVMIETKEGCELVLDELGRIEHGVFI